jgi:mercuric ion transport protein
MSDLEAPPRAPATRENRALPYLGLFSSIGTLLCCALPSLLVLLGFGATVASVLSFVPWLVTLSRHKVWVFGASALLLAANWYYLYRLAPRLLAARGACPSEEPDACARVTRFSRLLLWLAMALYAAGFAVAYVLPLLLPWLGS